MLARVVPVDQAKVAKSSLREQLKATVNDMIDELSDDDLKKIHAETGKFDWLSAGVRSHFTRVKNSVCK